MLSKTVGNPGLFPAARLGVLAPAHPFTNAQFEGCPSVNQVGALAVHVAIGLIEKGDAVVGVEHHEAVG